MNTKSSEEISAVKYESAKIVKYNSKDLLKFTTKLIALCFKVLSVAVPEFFKEVKKFFIAPKPKDITGQLAIVTGGSNGLGRDIAIELAQRGCNIAIVDVDLEGGINTAKDLQREYKVKAKAFKVDVSNYVEVEKLKEDIESSLGTVDILINNAGLMPLLSLCDGSSEDVQKLIDVNLTAHFWACRTFLKGMIQRKRGHIVAVSSMAAKLTLPMKAVYCASKFGVDGFMCSLFDELCIDNHEKYIKLTTAFPFFINTQKELSEMLDTIGEFLPRLTPEYTAKMIVKGMLENRKSLVIPFTTGNFIRLAQFLPARALKVAKRGVVDFRNLSSKRFN